MGKVDSRGVFDGGNPRVDVETEEMPKVVGMSMQRSPESMKRLRLSVKRGDCSTGCFPTVPTKDSVRFRGPDSHR